MGNVFPYSHINTNQGVRESQRPFGKHEKTGKNSNEKIQLDEAVSVPIIRVGL